MLVATVRRGKQRMARKSYFSSDVQTKILILPKKKAMKVLWSSILMMTA
jgi:hypothetical protein